MAVQTSPAAGATPFPNLLPNSPEENSSNAGVREGTGVLIHSLTTADTLNFSLSSIQTTFLVRSRQRLSHTDRTWKHKDPNEGELKSSGRKHFI